MLSRNHVLHIHYLVSIQFNKHANWIIKQDGCKRKVYEIYHGKDILHKDPLPSIFDAYVKFRAYIKNWPYSYRVIIGPLEYQYSPSLLSLDAYGMIIPPIKSHLENCANLDSPTTMVNTSPINPCSCSSSHPLLPWLRQLLFSNNMSSLAKQVPATSRLDGLGCSSISLILITFVGLGVGTNGFPLRKCIYFN